MLHTPIEIDEVVDSQAAGEFMKEATKVASGTELESIGERLEAKAGLFVSLLGRERIGELDEEGFRRLLATVFSLRRRGRRLLAANGIERLREQLQALLWDDATPLSGRFNRFLDNVNGIDRPLVISLASEALHFTDPRHYWLWTPWIWSPARGTGALRLVLHDGADLNAASDGEVYEKVGVAMAQVDAMGHAHGYSRAGRGLFGTDVFLACVYAVYMYTVFRVKLSQEFNRILPELPELAERVLGVRKLGGEG